MSLLATAASMAQTLPSGFTQQLVLSGLTEPAAVQFASDGRVFVAEKSGVIKVYSSLSATTPSIFADLFPNVHTVGDSGLLAMALAPNFPTDPSVYVFYTYAGPLGGPTSACVPVADNACVRSGRLSRLTATGDTWTGTEEVLVADWYQRYPGQTVGDLTFGPDGSLFASAGDGASSVAVDIGLNDSPSPDPPNQGGALRSQDLRTPADPITLSGSIIRIDPSTGAGKVRTTSMQVAAPTVDANGVRSYPVTSSFQGPTPTVVRVLEPSNPLPGRPRRLLFVLPVESGVTSTGSLYGDGFEELRLLDIHNRYNLTLIAPSFTIEPWYGDHDSDPERRLESFVIQDLVPFADTFATPGEVPARWAIGFSKSGWGALSLVLRNPNVFSAAAAWDAPAQLTTTGSFAGVGINFGTEANFDRYEIPTLVVSNAEAFRSSNRLWVGGDGSAYSADMLQLDAQLTQAGILHTFVQGPPRLHHWSSGWLESSVASLAGAAPTLPPVDRNWQRMVAHGLRKPARMTVRPNTQELWVADAGWENAEEINRLSNPTDGTIENFGWPCYEGTGTNGYASAGTALCADLSAHSGAATGPAFSYHPSQPVISGDACGSAPAEISALAFYGGSSYPTAYQGSLFFADRARGCIWSIPVNASGVANGAARAPFLSGAGAIVDLRPGAGGDLFYVDRSAGGIVRVSYAPGGADLTPPVRSNGSPSGSLVVGVTQTSLTLVTDETAICRYGTSPGTAYAALPNAFTTTGGNAHSTVVSGLAPGARSYAVRCQDSAGNVNANDFIISFTVAASSAPGLVAAYGFNAGSGTIAEDSSGNGLTGTITSAAWSATGRYGQALSFNGTSSLVTIGTGAALNLTTGMTLEAWVFPTSTTGTRDIIIKEGASVDIYNLYARNWRGVAEANVYVGGSNRTAEGATLPTNAWSHVAGTYDGTAVKLFVNGVQASTTAITGPIATSTGALRIGGNSLWGEYFQGLIDEVRIYNRALTPTELQADMNAPIIDAPNGIPTVSLDAPLNGATVAGLTTLTASASDDVAVVGVQFLLDGAPLGTEILIPPYTMSWNTSTSSAGSHTISARARDASGNTATASVTVTVTNNAVPGGFQDEVVVGGGLTFPTSFEFLPDGRMLVGEFQGRIMVAQPGASVLDATPVIQLPNLFAEDVTAGGERGLVNVVSDPQFSTNGFIYVFYTAAVPQRDRVSRFTMVGNTASPTSEFVVWQGVTDSSGTDHHGGGLAFGPDGKLYISSGDNGNPSSVQSLSSHHGKILRVNKDGTVPTDNPFFDGAGPNVDAIWALGLRNPYRFSFDAPTGRMYIGDVGLNATEEVNIGVVGANYGWPTCEGPCGTAGMTNPLFSYPHAGRDAAVTGGFVYRGSQFPAAYQGAYFYGDFAQNWIRYFTLNGAGAVVSNDNFLPPNGALDGPYDPVMLKPGPDGSLYYVDFGWGWLSSPNPASIRRIRYHAGNQPPVVVANALPASGPAPLSVSFSSAGTVDPENQPLSYVWEFGDGTTSTDANAVHLYTAAGNYLAQLTVSDGTATTASDVIQIAVGNPPQATVTAPANGLVFRAGDVITFAGTATDTEDGSLPPAAYSWTILFHHDSHVHPTLGPVTGLTNGTFTIPSSGHDFSGNTSYEIALTATDSTGLQTTRSVTIVPRKVNVNLATSPAGLTVLFDGVTTTTPFVKDTLSGFTHTVTAPNQTVGASSYGFASWSDGGAQTHAFVAGDVSSTLLANYQPTTTTTVAAPNSTTVLTGTLSSGTAAALATDDNSYYVVASTRSGTRTAAWYGSFINVPNTLVNLRASYTGRNSRNCTQTVALFNWVTNAWAQLDSRTVGTTEVALSNLAPAGVTADYVSGTSGSGEVRVRIQCSSTANLNSSGDFMSIVYETPTGTADTSAPVRSSLLPAGTLPSGTTQATLSLVTDESAACRYSLTPGTAYGAMTNAFTTVGGTTHTATVTALVDGGSYVYHVRCQDVAGNANAADAVVAFTVASSGTPGLVAAYGFNAGSGPTVLDSSGNSHTGSIAGATWSTAGRYGSALSFDGVSSMVTINTTSALNLAAAMTLEAWVFPTTSTGTRDILIKEGASADIYNLYARNWRGLPEANVFVGGGNQTAEGQSLPANVWSHVAGTYDGATLRLFVNGAQVASAAVTGSIAVSTGALRIGGNTLWGEFFQGLIDEIRIYNRALTPAELQADMNTPVP